MLSRPASRVASPKTSSGGILELVRTGNGPEASRKWAQSCMQSGECIKECDYGVNPRFLLTMARLGIAKSDNELTERRRQGVERYRDGSRGVTVLSRLQLDEEVLERLGQKSASVSASVELPDFVFYTGCNVLKTPHIALLALDIMDALGVSYRVMGGPSHCCGILQLKSGDAEMAGRMGSSTMEKLSHSNSGQVISWCPTCYVQYTETILPTVERQRGSRPFEMNPFMRFLGDRLSQLKRHLQRKVEMRVALHKHPGVAGVVEAAAEILKMVPGTELVDLNQPAVGVQSVNVSVLPKFKRELQLLELEAARDAGVDAPVGENAESLWPHAGLFPFSGNQGWRLGSILTAWRARQSERGVQCDPRTFKTTIQRSADGTSRRLFRTHFNFVTPDLSGRSRPARDSKLVELF